jgi:hypothetical protein
MWSGPGKALEEHLAMYQRVERARSYMRAHYGKLVSLQSVPAIIAQRMLLVSSMADATMGISVDGYSAGLERDDPNFNHAQASFKRADLLMDNEYQLLNTGETHYVSHNIKSMVEQAAAQAQDEPLFPTDLPCPAGLIVFEYPIVLDDLHPETGKVVKGLDMPTRAIGWRLQTVNAVDEDGKWHARDGIFYVCYTDRESYEALHIKAVEKLLLPEANEEARHRIRALDYMNRSANGAEMLGSWATDFSGWSFGMSWQRGGDDLPRELFAKGNVHDNVAIIRRFLLAYFRFTWQRILVPQKAKLARSELRRAERIRKMPEEGYVKVMRLRRHVEMERRGEKVDANTWKYEYAWITRGHPRRQHYATLGPARNPDGSFNVDSHRQIWIEPYLKGNPEGPIIRGHNVTAAVR